jgi:threonine aldolase
MIDLRSDTITKPTAQMRQAIAEAEVGDDVLGDDPTVIALEKRTADILGKESSVYMPSGTMTNQVAIRAHTEPGDEILIDVNAHCYFYEAGGPAALAGTLCRLLPGVRGIFTAEDLKDALRPANYHFPPSRLVCLENTHNRGGGSIWPIEQIAEVAEVARAAGLKLHLDGARLWNASVATGIAESQYAQYFDSVSVCFSKGLGAPVGSALAGSSRFIDRARRFRKQFGGAMRQAGIIAAGALYALKHHRERLAEDHKHAQILAQALAESPVIELNPDTVETNIIVFKIKSMPAQQLVDELLQEGVRVLAHGPDTIRAVTNLEVSGDQIDEAITLFKKTLVK